MADAGHIIIIEAIGPLLALCTFPTELRGCLWTHYSDSQAACGAMIRGDSPSDPLRSAAADAWLRACELCVHPWFHYVPSLLNPVDGFSRGEDFTRDPAGQAVRWCDPQLPDAWPLAVAAPRA